MTTHLIAAATYWVLIVLWGFAFWFFLSRWRSPLVKGRLVRILLLVLAIDAFRTLIDNIYFGAWYTSLAGLLPPTVSRTLTEPSYVLIPKLVSLIAAVLIILIVVRRWLPQEERQQRKQREKVTKLEQEVASRTEALRLANERLVEQLDQQRLLLNELDHRVKNNLASVIGIISLKRSEYPEASDFADSVLPQLHAFAQTHELLSASRWQRVEFGRLVDRLLAPFRESAVTIHTQGPSIAVRPTMAVPIGIILNELATNAAKHGAFATTDGTLTVDWRIVESGDLLVHWTEQRPTPIKEAGPRGFGLQMIESLARHDLRGDFSMTFSATGVSCFWIVGRDCLEPNGGETRTAA